MQLSDTQKENIRNSYIAYVTAIPVENAADLKQVQDILIAITKNRLSEINVPEKMVKSVAQLEEYVKLHLEINDDFPELKRYIHDLQKQVNAKIDTVINESKVEEYKKEQKNSFPKRANNTPVTQAFIDIFNIHAQLLPTLDCFVNSQSRPSSYLRDEDLFSSQTIPLFPIPLYSSMKVKKPMGHESTSLFFDAEEEEIADKYSYQLSPLRDMRLTGTPTLQPSFSLFNISDEEMDLFSFEEEQQQREDNKKESKLKILQSIMRNKESRQLLLGASIRFEPFLVLGEDANNFAFLLLTENNLGLKLYAQNLFNEHHFKQWGFDVALNYLLNLVPFDRQGLLDKGRPSRDFLLSLTPPELNLLDTLIKEKKLSIDKLSKMSDFSELDNLIRLNRFHPFSYLPEELQKNILNYLSIKDIGKLRVVSKSTKKVIDELVIRPANIALLVEKLSFFDLYNFIQAYSSHPGFKPNFKKALESNLELTFNFSKQWYPVQFFYVTHRAGSNLFEKEYNKISQDMIAEQSKIENEYGEKYKIYLKKKAKYEELEKQFQDELQEYVKKSKTKKDGEPIPEKPERKFNPKPQEPSREEEVKLSKPQAKQIILYALTVDDVYKLDIKLLKQAIETLSDELSHDLKYGLEKMIMIITSPNIDVADFNSHGVSLSEDKDKILINLRNIQLIGFNLQNINLANADLSNANFTGANLVGAALENTNLSGANLSDAKLTKANLIDADLTGIVVNANTTLEGAKFFDESQSTKEIHQELDKIFSQLKTNPSFEYLSLAMAKDFIDKFITVDCNRTMSFINKQLDKNPDISYEQFDKFSDSLKKLLELVTQFKKHPLFNTVNLDEIQPRFDKYENEIYALMDRLEKNFDVRFHP